MVETKIMDGKKIAAEVRTEIKGRVDNLKSRFVEPGLAMLLENTVASAERYAKRLVKSVAELPRFFQAYV
jgi:5,10-methylene-tetrahydrofolate dehydrogenase/methenyl tetrahydrofolate cyclohydrolase